MGARPRVLVLATVLLFGVTGCGGGGGGDDFEVVNAGSPISITSPANGFSTTANSITVEGHVNRRDGTFPNGSVSWTNGGSSGSTSVYCGGAFCCFIVCTGSWQATVPLNDGTNTITATFQGANASVTVTRIPVSVVSGRVFVQGTGVGLTSPDVLVSRTDPGGSPSVVTRLDASGNYAFTGLLAGSYTISPHLTPPESWSCLTFSPATRTVDVTTEDVPGQDFAAAAASACHSVRGRVTASNNPGFGVKDINVFIRDSYGNSFRKVTDAQGFYEFHFLLPATYTVTPESCYMAICNTFIPANRNVTIVSADVTGQDFLEQF